MKSDTVNTITGVLLIVASLWASIRELHLLNPDPFAEYLTVLERVLGYQPVPMSISRQRDWLLQCDDALEPFTLGLLSPQWREKTKSDCENWTSAVLRKSPNDSLAHLVMAKMHLLSGQTLEGTKTFENSITHGPNEGWLSERRFALAAQHDALFQYIGREIPALLRSQSGAELGAEYYLRRPDLQPAFNNALSDIAEHNSRRFANRIKIQARGE